MTEITKKDRVVAILILLGFAAFLALIIWAGITNPAPPGTDTQWDMMYP